MGVASTHRYVPLAQSVEHLTFNQRVTDSSSVWYTIPKGYKAVTGKRDLQIPSRRLATDTVG